MPFSDKHIFFDLDRTLWDFDKNSALALEELYLESNLSQFIRSFEQFHKVYLNKNKSLWIKYAQGKLSKEALRYERFRSTFHKLGVFNEDLVLFFGDEYVNRSPKQTAMLPHAKNTLEDLKDMGFNLHIITNGFYEVQHIKLKYSNIHHHFDIILCSEEAGVNKPHRLIFNKAMELANAKAINSLMVGDDYRADIVGSLRSGMQAIWFQPNLNRKSKFENKVNCLSDVPLLAAKLLA